MFYLIFFGLQLTEITEKNKGRGNYCILIIVRICCGMFPKPHEDTEIGKEKMLPGSASEQHNILSLS
jgi:hypothetical protein